MSYSGPDFIYPDDPKFHTAVADVVSRYDFSIDRKRCMLDAIGRYVELCVVMTQKKDADDTREVYLQRQRHDDIDGWVWYALNINMPFYAQHKAAVYAEACRVALDIDGVRDYAPRGTVASKVAGSDLLTVSTMDICPDCASGYLVQRQCYSEEDGITWRVYCLRCLYTKLHQGM